MKSTRRVMVVHHSSEKHTHTFYQHILMYTHMHIHVHTHVHMHKHTYIHTHTHTCIERHKTHAQIYSP